MTASIESLLKESRVFPPDPEFSAHAHITSLEQYKAMHARSLEDPEGFWKEMAERLHWFTAPTKALEHTPPHAKWFLGGTTNLAYNCLDRHLNTMRRNKAAIVWEGEPGDVRTLTYHELHRETCRFANVLRKLGVRTGDRVAIYMGMVPEIAVALLACARIGATHTVIFGGFAAEAVRDRVNDARASVIITCDGAFRRGQTVPLKNIVDNALASCPSVRHTVVYRRTGEKVTMEPGRDHWWHELVAAQPAECEPERMGSEDLLYLLYTSGTTAKPKGIMHTTGGYLTQVAFTHHYTFDLKADRDVYWCAADCGWVTGHSYIVYGPLANAATSVMYEGTPDTPRAEFRAGARGEWPKDRFWDIIERYGVTQLYTAPTAIRTFMKWGADEPARHDLSTLRVLGTVGEPINPEAWMWYHAHIGGGTCPIVDTWWQTETGGHMIAPLPGVVSTKPGSATFALPGIGVEVVDDHGVPVKHGGGYLTLTQPWPAMLRGIWGDPDRYRATYWSEYEGRYFAGDGAKVDEDGYLWLLGRVDDVMNVSGHRISTTEVESALVDHPAVAEAAVVGATDETTGQAIVGYVILRGGHDASDALGEEIRQHVAKKLGPIARPKQVVLVPDLPKTRSGKIMRRLLRDVAEGRTLGDTTTLADPNVFDEIRRRAAGASGED